MPGPRVPTDVLKANGRKHLSKKEEAERRAGEVVVEKPKTAKFIFAVVRIVAIVAVKTQKCRIIVVHNAIKKWKLSMERMVHSSNVSIVALVKKC